MKMRLQKYLARSGVASRRTSEKLIAEGHVRVNGELVCEMGTSVDPTCDEICVDGIHIILTSDKVTLMLHKPAGFVSTMKDPQGRPTVAELIPVNEYPGLYPIGRLDVDTTGLLLFSTDGELGHALLHPRHHVMKRYLALVEGGLLMSDVEKLRAGIELSDGMTLPAEVSIQRGFDARTAAVLIGDDDLSSGYAARHSGKRSRAVLESEGTYVLVGLRQGRKRQVRRMFEAVGHPVIALHRVSFGSVDLGDLPRGEWRMLTDDEISSLQEDIQDK